VPARHPYAGELVFTAFSGSHQDAIKKGLQAMEAGGGEVWEVPYLPIDPADVGRQYDPIIRINSQSGKGGVAFVLEHYHGYILPKGLAAEFALVVQDITDSTGTELQPDEIHRAFQREYLEPGRFELADFDVHHEGRDRCSLKASLSDRGMQVSFEANGNGPIDAFVRGLREGPGIDIHVLDYSEHALGDGASATAVAYVQLRARDGATRFGVGQDEDIVAATLEAVLSAVNGLQPKTRRDAGARRAS